MAKKHSSPCVHVDLDKVSVPMLWELSRHGLIGMVLRS